MLCQNCGKNEVTFRYTQIVNGVKKEMALCDKCARELGLDNMDFSMPISMSSFLGDMLNEYSSDMFMPTFGNVTTVKCKDCGTSYNDFIETGRLGCASCYDIFENRIDALLRNIQGATRHVGRISKYIGEANENNVENQFNWKNKEDKKVKKVKKEKNKLEQLKEDLNKAIKEERYEDAAKIRDEIKEEENKK